MLPAPPGGFPKPPNPPKAPGFDDEDEDGAEAPNRLVEAGLSKTLLLPDEDVIPNGFELEVDLDEDSPNVNGAGEEVLFVDVPKEDGADVLNIEAPKAEGDEELDPKGFVGAGDADCEAGGVAKENPEDCVVAVGADADVGKENPDDADAEIGGLGTKPPVLKEFPVEEELGGLNPENVEGGAGIDAALVGATDGAVVEAFGRSSNSLCTVNRRDLYRSNTSATSLNGSSSIALDIAERSERLRPRRDL
jgi:hypothetical protein